MKKVGLILLAGFCLSLAPRHLTAQSDDPSEVFLKAYMTSQQGEKLEHDNHLQGALAKFRFAGSLLEELRKSHADWQPAIVDFRSRKIGENIVRVQNKLGTQKDLAATSAPPPVSSSAPVLPDRSGPAEPTVEVTAPRRSDARVPVPPAEPRPSVATDAAGVLSRFVSRPAITAPFNAGAVGPARRLRWMTWTRPSRKQPKNCRTKWISCRSSSKSHEPNMMVSQKRRRT